MNQDTMSFTKVKVNHDLLNEIWAFDPRTLDQVDGSVLSSYAMALSQYLIYYTFQLNLSKAEMHRLSKYIDRTVSITLSSDPSLMKKYKTKSSAQDYIVATNESLMKAQADLDDLKIEMMKVDGIDKNVSELIATIKRELTRRENELYSVRMERR